MTLDEVQKFYSNLLNTLTAKEEELKKGSFYLSILRLAFFIVLIGLTIYISSINGVAALVFSIIGILVFLYIVKAHHQKERERQIVSYKNAIISNEIAAINDLTNANYNGEKFIDQQHTYSSDLDVFGPFSLFALMNRCRTYDGMMILADFLSTKPSSLELKERREAILELEKSADWRIEFLSTLFEVENGDTINVAEIVQQTLATDLSFAQKKWLKNYRIILPFLWLCIGVSYLYQPSISYALAIVIGLINFRITMSHADKVTIVQHRLSKASANLDKYATSLTTIYKKTWKSSYLKMAVANPVEDNVKSLNHLKKISDLLDYRLHLIPSAILNIGLLWDSKICHKLAHWHKDNGHSIKESFHLVGLLESLTSLATWSYNHPEGCYPKVDEKYFHFAGSNLRHPLLKMEACVPNDFNIQNEEFVGIITGSNMSGKSTFLRTLGLNIVLGNTGTRVHATSLTYCLCELITYMRIKDALEENVSTFKSELNRVVKMLELVDSDRPSLILADEMLRGTNSDDKLKGSKAIVKRIVSQNSYALVATHDIGLAHLGTDNKSITNHYFDIDYADGELVFDYKIKEGICQSFNASFLLSQLGLEMT